MTELKRSHGSLDPGSAICTTVKRHKTQNSISIKERKEKEKLGQKISALQQLVSPFGKSDTASVLLEATGYIKFLQDQVQVLSAPYLQCRPTGKFQESDYYSLRNRGLCLVPVAWTLNVARSNGADIWAPIMTGSPRF
ncbi:transcription factor bHLH153-like [Tasmannia lanceolata]|uniref:transcription factor bHLH153-like n=1 Tax=Tasmannia lanceolata TaxID=3420 RepID=UPI004064571F